jgi:hypothetical protein
MKKSNINFSGLYTIKDSIQNNPCYNCSSCIRFRIMEMGLMPGTKVSLNKYHSGLWTLSMLNDDGLSELTVALRDEEVERMVSQDECAISFHENN